MVLRKEAWRVEGVRSLGPFPAIDEKEFRSIGGLVLR